jgi:short-subunit dehydrogenase
MPFFMDAPKAAKIIINGLKKNKARIAFPLPVYALVWLMSSLPVWLTDTIFRKLPTKE